MKFIIIYKNRDDIRIKACDLILEGIKQNVPFDRQPIQTPFFQSRLMWPSFDEINQINLGFQVEEIEIKDNQIISIRKLVIDLEPNTPKADIIKI